MTTLHLDLNVNLGGRRNISIHAHPPMSVHIREIRDIQALSWCPGVFFVFSLFFLFCHPGPMLLLANWNQVWPSAHQPAWKHEFSRTLPAGQTWRNPLWAPTVCWILCRQMNRHRKGTLARCLFKHASDSNLDSSQAEGPDSLQIEGTKSSQLSPGFVHFTALGTD